MNDQTSTENRQVPRVELERLVSLLDCSTRLKTVCRENGILTLRDMSKYMRGEFLMLPKCGRKTANEARYLLQEVGLDFVAKQEMPKDITECPIAPYEPTPRNKAIVAMVACGETCKMVGSIYGISGARVTGICATVIRRIRGRSETLKASYGAYDGSIETVRACADVLIAELYLEG